MTLSLSRLEQFAPDQSSLTAAGKLRKPALWPLRATDGKDLVWGECQGSASAPYRMVAALDDLAHRCSCPSRKFPCKHVLALLWQYVEGPKSFETAEPPDWVLAWAMKRRPSTGAPAKKDGPALSIGAAVGETAPAERDEAAEAQAAERREKQRLAREESIAAGLDELDRWIADQLDRGLASFEGVAAEQCRLAARRLVDAKAPSLATLVDELAAELFRVGVPQRGGFLMERLAQFHLIAAAYRRQEELPEPLRHDARRAVGWSQRREELLTDTSAPRGRGHWFVAGNRSVVQADRLRRLETWLLRLDGEGPEFALLLDFVPLGAAPTGSSFAAGESFEGELVFFPSASPLRAIVAERRPAARVASWPFGGRSLGEALDAWETAIVQVPWQARWPIAGHASLARIDERLVLTDEGGHLALPVDAVQADALLPLLGVGDVTVAAVWDGREAHLLAAETPLGRWLSE